MKIEKLKYYGGMLALALALASAPVNTLEVRAEDEVLYEDTEDDYTLEDITEEEQANREAEEEAARKAQEEAERKAAEEEAARKAAEEAAAAENPLENTKIDEEDQKYNTGRDEIPDTVLTEWERKHPGDTPPGDTPPGDTPPGDTPPGDTPPGDTPQDTPSNVPKTGAGAVGLILAGAATGIYLGNRNILKYKEAKLSGLKVVDSKKKFKKASKGLTK